MIVHRSSLFVHRHRAAFFWLAVLAFMVIGAPELLAQDEAAPAPEPVSWLHKWVLAGGVWMVPLGLCSIALIAFTVLCIMSLGRSKFVPAPLKAELLDLMHQCRVRSAIESAAQSPTFLGRMMTVALPHFDMTEDETMGREKVENSMVEFATQEVRTYQKWISTLSVLAQISPMLGLFGTVVGMVMAFETLSITGGAEPAALAGDISIALLTTFAGLFVAIPSLALFFVFKNRLNDLVAETVASGIELVDACVHSAHGETRAAKIPEGLSL